MSSVVVPISIYFVPKILLALDVDRTILGWKRLAAADGLDGETKRVASNARTASSRLDVSGISPA